MDKHIKLLFIGNSATYVHDIPETLALLAGKAGYFIETKRIVKGGYRLSQHADLNTERGSRIRHCFPSGQRQLRFVGGNTRGDKKYLRGS